MKQDVLGLQSDRDLDKLCEDTTNLVVPTFTSDFVCCAVNEDMIVLCGRGPVMTTISLRQS